MTGRDGEAPAVASPPAKRARTEETGSAEEALLQGCEKLKQWTKDLQGSGDVAGGCSAEVTSALLSLLQHLATLPIDAGMLKRTGAGREVNQKWIRTHADERVKRASADLVHSWKAAATGSSAAAAPAVAVPVAVASATGGREVVSSVQSAGSAVAREVSEQGESSGGDKQEHEEKKQEKASEDDKKEKKEQASKNDKRDKKDKATKDDKKEKHETSHGEGSNKELSELFKELSSFEFKLKQKFAGIAYKRVAGVLADMEDIKSILQVKGVKGIGNKSVAKIEEFLETGKIERLERYRRGDFEYDD